MTINPKVKIEYDVYSDIELSECVPDKLYLNWILKLGSATMIHCDPLACKVLQENSKSHSFMCVCGCFTAKIGSRVVCDRDFMGHKT